MICEVVSKHSVFRDYTLKRKADQAIESMRDYLIINAEAEVPFVAHCTLGPKQSKKHPYDEPDDTIELSSVGVTLTVAEIYRDIEFE